MVKGKRIAALFIILALVGGLLAACTGKKDGTGTTTTAAPSGTSATAAPKGEKITLVYVSPGSEPTDLAKRQAAINSKLAADGLNIALDMKFIGWDAWDQKTNLMLSSGEAFDNMSIMSDLKKTSVYIGRDAVVPIDAYLDKYPNLKKAFPDYVWDSLKINGKIYSLPVFYREWSNDYELVSYRADLLKKYNLQVPKNQAELIAAAETIKKGENNPKMQVTIKPNTLMNGVHREYSTYPFTVVDDLIYIDQKGAVKSWMESPEFKQDNQFFHTLYTKGLINPDILTLPLDQVTKQTTDGNFSFTFANELGGETKMIQTAVPSALVDVFRLAPDKPWFRPLLMNNENVIPKTSKHPEAMVQFYDWLYSKQENYDLMAYGIKDDWWKDAGPNKMETIHPQGKEVQLSEWKLGYYKYARIPVTADPKVLEYQQINDKAVNAVNAGFTFDSTPVSVEYTNLLAEVKTTIYPLKLGVVDYDKAYPAALAKMKAAGLDKVVAEYDKQFQAWLKSKK